MAVEYIAWSMKQKVGNPTAKVILLALANYAGKDGTCYPGQKTLQTIAEGSESTVRRALKHLENAGLISRKKRGKQGGGRTTDLYILNIENQQKSKPVNMTAKGGKPVTGDRIKPVKAVTGDITVSNNRQYPPYIPPEVWHEYLEHRKDVKATMTPRALRLVVLQLDEAVEEALED